jgi:hypothetical protein
MSASTTAPVEAGTTYPMPPKPVLAADEPDLCEGSIGWDHDLSDPSDPFTVSISRRDWIQAHSVTVGDVELMVAVEEYGPRLTPQQARQLAALLVEAADLAE